MRQLGHLEALDGRLALGFFGQDRQIILSVLSFVFDVPLMPSSRVYAHDAFVDSRISPYHEATRFQLSLPTWANHQHGLAPLPPAANGEWVRQLSPQSYLISTTTRRLRQLGHANVSWELSSSDLAVDRWWAFTAPPVSQTRLRNGATQQPKMVEWCSWLSRQSNTLKASSSSLDLIMSICFWLCEVDGCRFLVLLLQVARLHRQSKGGS